MFMTTTIQKWGNSQGIRIPKILLDTVKWNENEELEQLKACLVHYIYKKPNTIDEKTPIANLIWWKVGWK